MATKVHYVLHLSVERVERTDKTDVVRDVTELLRIASTKPTVSECVKVAQVALDATMPPEELSKAGVDLAGRKMIRDNPQA